MRLELWNVVTRVLDATSKEESWLDDYLTIETTQSRYSGYPLRLYNRFGKHFPTGLAGKVKRTAEAEGMTVRVTDMRRVPCQPDTSVDVSWLRSYQAEAVETCYKKTRGILHHPTGSGKTESSVALMLQLKCNWLFLTHRTTLIHQAAERIKRYSGEPVGIIGDRQWNEERITFASFQTLFAALKNKATKAGAERFLESRQGLICDEAHVVAATTFLKVTMSTPNAYWRFGLSGTPLARDDRKSICLVGAIGPVIHKIEPQVLIDAGILAKPEITITPIFDPVPAKGSTFAEAYQAGIVESDRRNKAVLADVLAAAKPCLVFVKAIEHGKILERMIGAKRISVEFLSGRDQTHTRITAIKDLAYSNIEVLIATVILREGVDIPEVQSVVNAAGGKSLIDLIQKLGRGMRTRDSKGNITKTHFKIYDYLDKGNRWLQKHSYERIAACQAQGYEVVHRTVALNRKQVTQTPNKQ